MNKDGEEFEKYFAEYVIAEKYGEQWSSDIHPHMEHAFKAGQAAAKAEAQGLLEALSLATGSMEAHISRAAEQALAAYRKEPRP